MLITQQSPEPYNKGGKNGICHNTKPYHKGGTNNNRKNKNIIEGNNNTKTANNPRFDDNPVIEKSNNNWRCPMR